MKNIKVKPIVIVPEGKFVLQTGSKINLKKKKKITLKSKQISLKVFPRGSIANYIPESVPLNKRLADKHWSPNIQTSQPLIQVRTTHR